MTELTPSPESPVKECSRCRQAKARSDFHKCTANRDGLNAWCKACAREYQREKPNGVCQVDGCQRVTTMGSRKCNPCYAGAPPLAQAHRTRGMPRYDDAGNRLCSDCLEYLPVSEFGVHSRNPDGLSRFCRSCARVKNVRKKYGLTIAEAEKMWATPCNICGFFADGEMVIDHCHDSGGVRGTLCHPCNVSIGHFRDDPALLDKAAQYLRRFPRDQASQDRPEQTEVRHAPRARGWSTHKRRKSICP